ncbi:MAG: AtpZ/AtpI family protein [Candidatus Aminicenantes bacterium]|jgi:ATP synthase protein I
MAEEIDPREKQRRKFTEEVEKRETRKIKARREKDKSVWFGLGMFGLVGWAVSLPTLIGVSVGLWIDSKWPSPISWTLICLFVGVVLGCLNAWYWVSRERERIGENKDDE